jgi:hypothetical protein
MFATVSHSSVLGCLLVGELSSADGVLILDISARSFFVAIVPDQLRARVSGVYRTVNYGIQPLGVPHQTAQGDRCGIHLTPRGSPVKMPVNDPPTGLRLSQLPTSQKTPQWARHQLRNRSRHNRHGPCPGE